ncbi:hypothetical protein AMTRI_Chr02g257030 [Amborella trichopoda]|uniref:Uncharacterized protein n=1 Tax=Amborella trichopoda TaxID=13333 RepID=U5DDS1_AMBTC|nr:hypothetical protein AMTR_s00062p00091090 [Amborella trichopoda]
MAAISRATPKAPLEIGTRGTIGSLVLQEIEYFRSVDHHKKQLPIIPSSMESFGSKIGSLETVVRTQKKKKKGGSRFLPSICSLADVAVDTRPERIPDFCYTNLKVDVKKLHR